MSIQQSFQDLGADLLVCADETGHVLEYLPPAPPFDPHILASLAVANLMAAREMKMLSHIASQEEFDFLITTSQHGLITIVQRADGLVFIAVMRKPGQVGISKLLLARLAREYQHASKGEISSSDRDLKQKLLKQLQNMSLPLS